MQRRTFLKAGVIGGVALAATGGAVWLRGQDAGVHANGPAARRIFAALLPAFTAGALPAEPRPRAAALAGGLDRTLAAIGALPAGHRRELGELMLLLDSPPGRWLAGIDDWNDAPVATVTEALQRWRTHRLALLQTAYHALHDLALGPWYADPATWDGIGYPGPIAL